MDERPEEDAIYIIIGDAIRRRRREIGMRQQDLAERLDMTRTSISNIEVGRQHLPIHVLCAIAAILTVPVAALFQEAPSTHEGQKHVVDTIRLRLDIIHMRKQLDKIRAIVLEDGREGERKEWLDA